MEWIPERAAALKFSLGPRRYVLLSLVGGIVTFVDWVLTRLAEAGVSYFFGWPAWVTGLFAALILVAYWLLESVVKLRRQLAPTLSLSFKPDNGGIVETPEKVRDAKTGEVIRELRTVFVRIGVETSTDVAVENCTPFLVSVTKKSDGFKKNQFFDPIQLPWSLTTTGAIQMYKGVRRHVDVFLASERENKLEFARGSLWSLTLRDYLDDETTYRAEVIVVGGGLSQSIKIEVHWTGNWKTLTAKRA